MRKTIIVLWVALCATQALIAQNSNQNLLPNVIGPSPEVAQLGKFGSYDVNNFTGVPSIAIPIHEILAKDINVPITLKYHPSGIKVSDRPSMVGLGWSLDVGGFISRQVLGLADEFPEGYANNDLPESFNTLDATDLGYLNDVNRGLIDSEPDIFSYSFGSYSGKFILDRLQNSPDANNSVATGGSTYFTPARIAEAELGCDDDDVLMIPYQPVDIQPLYGSSSVGFKAFDPFGKEYQFDAFETTKDVNEALNKRSGWKISKIISKNKSTTVDFTYTSRYGQVSHDRSYSVVVNDLVANYCPPGGGTPYSPVQGQYSYKEHRMWSTEQYIQTIDYPLGKVEFGYAAGRPGGFSGQDKLEEIRIYKKVGSSYDLIKKVSFTYGVFVSTDGSSTQRLKLDAVDIEDDAGNVIQSYDFGYNTSHILPKFLSTSRDLWGYFNNQTNQRSGSPTLVPKHVISYQATAASAPNSIELGSTNANGRVPNETYMQACILNKITHPTGGWTEFDYEANRYLDGSTTKLAGGLRVAQIRSYEKVGATPIKQTFKYGAGESGIGRANFLAGRYTFDNEVTHRSWSGATNFCASMRSRTYVSSPSIALEPFDQAPVVYPEVTVYSGDVSANIGKTIYEFWDYGDTPGPGFQIGTPTVESNHFRRGQLKRKRSYRFDGGSNFTLVQEVNNTYGAFGLCQNGKMGLKVTKLFVNGAGDIYLGVNPTHNLNDHYSFQYAYYRVIRGDDRLLSSEEINYPETGNPYTVLTEYFYDRYDHQQVTFTNTTSSKGESLSQETYFPHDVSGAVYNDMVSDHQIAFPVIETSLRGTVEVQKVIRNYHEPLANIFEPLTITTQRNGGTTFTEGTFHSYDSFGNPTSYTGRDGVKKSILWSFDGHYPIVVADHVDLVTLQFAVNNSLPTGFPSLEDLVEDMSNIANSSSAQANWELFNDNLRAQTSLAGAYLQTFTYNPSVGQTSSTDISGLTTYYNYDTYNRLYQVKDFQGNVLKEHKYHYHNN